MKTQPALQEQYQPDLNQLSQEAKQIIELLDQIENHTAELRKKLMAELKQTSAKFNLRLDEV